jgi:hypothetical protein
VFIKESEMRYRAAIPLLGLLLGFLLTNVYPSALSLPVTAAAGPPGYIGLPFYYKPSSAARPLVQSPSGEKPQSKLWFNDGRWWGSLFNRTYGTHRIYWLDQAKQQWIDTGVTLDPRAETKADCLWDGTHLYVVSGGGSDLNNAGTRYPWPAVLYRFSYIPATKTYIKDFGPVTVRNGGAETIVLDKDTTGKIWVTYTQSSKVYINHSGTTDSDWSPAAAMVVPAPDARRTSLTPDDISSLVAFDGKVGVLWSNESVGQFSGSNDSAFYFAYHVDGTADTSWISLPVFRQPAAADDHINLKALQSDASGNVFAMIKTSENTVGTPQLLLLVAKKQSNGTYKWSSHIESFREDKQTRPLLMIDTENRDLYVFTSTEGGGDIYYKSTSIDNIQFGSGPGTLFMTRSGYSLNNVTSTKQTVNSLSGIVVLSSHDNESSVDTDAADYYFHNTLALHNTGTLPTPKTPTVTPTKTPIPTPTTDPSTSSRSYIYLPLLKR